MSFDRRRFLSVSAASLSGALLAACGANPESAAKLLDFAERKNEGLERGLFRHDTMDRVPASAKLAGKDFPKYFISKTVPVWDPSVRGTWRLEVSGAVRTPLSLTLDDLMKLPHITQKVDHFCVEGWNARAEWTGVRVSDIARVAGITGAAHYVDFQSFDDDYHESWDMASAMHPQTLLAYGMDGRMLGPEHGAPARVHSPVKLGYKNTKYLTKVVFMPQRNGGYWSDQGYEWYGGT
ncbi:MAG TPA: molybdopterin-dependent oxidoreductase [Gemmatimonadaceae bacterium]|jgi:DMSO/TMAO reductase YedYZ molybdopterin-dependent catalytic subunit